MLLQANKRVTVNDSQIIKAKKYRHIFDVSTITKSRYRCAQLEKIR